MNRKILLLVVLLALVAVAWWLSQRGEATTLDKPLTDFAVADTAGVTRLFIADKKGRTVDLRRQGGRWILNGKFEARQELINTALKTLRRVEVRSPVPKSAEPMVLRTMGGAALKLEIYEGGSTPSKTWIIGHATKDHFGTYMVLEKPDEGRSSAPFVMGMGGFTGILSPRFPANVDDWRSTAIFRFNDLRDLASVDVEHSQSPQRSYRIENDAAGRVRLTDLRGTALPMDTVLVKGALLPYRAFDHEYFERKMKPASRDSLLRASPNFIIRTRSRMGQTTSVKLWYQPYRGEGSTFDEPQLLHDPMRMHALIDDTLLVVVQRQFTDLMTQPASALMP